MPWKAPKRKNGMTKCIVANSRNGIQLLALLLSLGDHTPQSSSQENRSVAHPHSRILLTQEQKKPPDTKWAYLRDVLSVEQKRSDPKECALHGPICTEF